jgi:hypothetical protein
VIITIPFTMNPSECEMTVNSSPGDVKMNTWCKLIPSGELPHSRVGHTGLHIKRDHKVSREVKWHSCRKRHLSGARIRSSNDTSVNTHNEVCF